MTFEEYYSAFRTYRDVYSEEYRKRTKKLRPLLIEFMPEKGKVLDIGCGAGGVSFLLEDLGFNVIGIDNSDYMLSLARGFAREKGSTVEFIKADARELPFKGDSFDYVLFIDGVFHFAPPDLSKVFFEAGRVLRPGGKFIIQFTDMRSLLKRLKERQIIGEEFWISHVITDEDERTALIEFQSEEKSFHVRFNIWGKTAIELLAKLYFMKVKEEKMSEHTYFQVYLPKK
ncbi:class I SAM-dependent methyltransferase [Thermococcus sp.]